MPRPRFSEMLVERRRRLGLSVEQASRVLKLKEQVLVAFEEGDFRSIPKSGYAQGMLSSYARYLGLNPREVVDQFQEDLYEHTNGVVSHDLRRRTREGRGMPQDPTYEVPRRSSNPNLPSPPHLLPENPLLGDTGEFETTSPARSRAQSWRRAAASGRPYAAGGRAADPGYGPRPRSQEPARGRAGRPAGSRYRSGDIVRRDVGARQYDDDLRYGNDAQPYQPASTRQGRSSYRSIASAERPRVQRRRGDEGRRELRRRDERRAPRRPGVLGVLQVYFSDPRRTVVTVLAVLVVLLILIISSSVRACTSSSKPETRSVAVQTMEAGGADEGDSAADDADASDADGADAGAAGDEPADETGDGTQDETADAAVEQEVRVTVKVADGAVTWIEITNGGRSEVAETVTGPWEQTYTVTDGMTIQVSDTSAVTVTRNGQNVPFDSRASGVGSAVIQGPAGRSSGDADAASGTDEGDAEGESDASE